jgi:hypothetical protein
VSGGRRGTTTKKLKAQTHHSSCRKSLYHFLVPHAWEHSFMSESGSACLNPSAQIAFQQFCFLPTSDAIFIIFFFWGMTMTQMQFRFPLPCDRQSAVKSSIACDDVRRYARPIVPLMIQGVGVSVTQDKRAV